MIPATKGNAEHEWDGAILKIYGHNEDEHEFANLTLPGVSEGIAYDTENGQKIGPFDITFVKTVHPVVAYAMRIVERKTGQSLVFTADTGWFEGLVPFAQDADVLLADVYFFAGNENHPAHLTSLEAGRAAREAGAKRLVLTHLPQFGDLEVLRQQAADEAGDAVGVSLAVPHETIDFNEI
jgi:ribonuclease BN (tRNA processing enzyme)